MTSIPKQIASVLLENTLRRFVMFFMRCMFPMGQLVFMFAVEHNILGVWYNEDNLRQEFDFFSSLRFVILSVKMKKK